LILQQIQRIVSAGTPDLSGRMLNGAGSLPHECGVPPQCPVAPRANSLLLQAGKGVLHFVEMHVGIA
jgi:hypothetical protein